jgi:UDP-glucose 4-epimerase
MGGPSFRGIRKEMRILLTGSSGWLGQTLVPRLSGQGHQVNRLGPDTLGSHANRWIGDGPRTRAPGDSRVWCRFDHRCRGAAQANIETHRASDFVAVNVQGTLNLLER